MSLYGYNNEDLCSLLDDLLRETRESEWVEFKSNNQDPQLIGEYISAIANSATLHRKDKGYLVWGIVDESREVVGCSFEPTLHKVGNQALVIWLQTGLKPRVNFQFHSFEYKNQRVVMLMIQPTAYMPVGFLNEEYIRVGTSKAKLRDYPEKEKEIWRIAHRHNVELDSVNENAGPDTILGILDYRSYFQLQGQGIPQSRDGILQRLTEENIIKKVDNDRYDVTRLGALLFAVDLADFPEVSRRAVRIIKYKGRNRIEAIRELTWNKGYASGFKDLIRYINQQLPTNEALGQAFRVDKPMYPEIAIRELVANAVIHQDLTIRGTSPLVEMFDDRIEITNPGSLLIDPLRLMDTPPQSRNEKLADLLRRLGICEERGSGIDKVVSTVELYQLPPPSFRIVGENTQVTLFAPQKLRVMSREAKIQACYQHACLYWMSNNFMTNSTLRKRLGIADANHAAASRIISDTLAEGLIKPNDPTNKSKRMAGYLPFWV